MIGIFMGQIARNLEVILDKIDLAKQEASRETDVISLIAVSKTKPVEQIEQAIKAGQYVFGENYVQEGVQKIHYFKETQYAHALEWHFIGPLQSNKSKLVAENFDWIHTIDSKKLISRLASQRPKELSPLNALIQINISNEPSKSGVYLSEVDDLVEAIMSEDKLLFRGLMAIPAPLSHFPSTIELNNHFKLLSALKVKIEELKNAYPKSHIDTLSMGMSDDLKLAIKAGSTMVRIGSAIFGARNYDV